MTRIQWVLIRVLYLIWIWPLQFYWLNELTILWPSLMCLYGISKPVMLLTVTDALYEHAMFCYPISYGDAGDNQRKNRKHSLCKWVPLALILRASKHFVLLSFGFDITLIPSFLLGLYWVGVFAAELCVSFHIFFLFIFLLCSFWFVILFVLRCIVFCV